MSNDRRPATAVPEPRALSTCRWCGGPLVFEPQYPVLRLIPGDPVAAESDAPHALSTLPAWVCATPFCKYREKA